jgi:hypothetical protein
MSIQIIALLGTCSSTEIGNFAEKSGRKLPFKTAKKAIKDYDPELYKALSLDLRTYYEDYTNVKTGELLGIRGRFLHIVHSAVDYIFHIN